LKLRHSFVYTLYCTSKIYRIVALTNMNKYLRNGTSEMELNVRVDISENDGSEKLY
jgi:hypothetical protein